MDKKIIQFVFGVLNQVKLYHWATRGYSVHKALDDLHTNMGTNIDKLIEAYLGTDKPVGKFSVSTSSDSNTANIAAFLKEARRGFQKMRTALKQSQLQNIVDEITADIDQTLYLLRLS
jgi:DNA-binding ferritin-like protein